MLVCFPAWPLAAARLRGCRFSTRALVAAACVAIAVVEVLSMLTDHWSG
jgi:hypothetical protein